MPKPTLIGLVGAKEAGKDTVGAILVSDYGYERRAFADPLKQEVLDCLNSGELPRFEPLVIPDDIKHILAVYRGHGEDVYVKPTSADMRRLQQWWGNELRRTFDPDYWVKQTARNVADSPIVITDVRFPNEVDFVRSRGGALVKINRAKPDSTNSPAVIESHVSEALAQSDSVEFDLIIDNNGTISDLQLFVAQAFGPAAPVEPPAPVEPTPTKTQPDEQKAVPVPVPVVVAPASELSKAA